MKKTFFIAVLVLCTLACATVTNLTNPQPTPIAATPISIQPTSTPIATSETTIRREDVEIYCPSNVTAATNAFNKAAAFESAGDDVSAEKAYREAIDLDPQFCDALDNLALLLKRAGNFKDTVDLYQRSIAIHPDGYVAHLGLANTYNQLEQYENAIAEYETLTKLYPDDPEGYYGLGNVYFNQEKYEEALGQFKIAEEIYKKRDSGYIVDAQVYIGYTYVMLEDYESGRDYIELAYPDFEKNGYTNYMLGICYYYGKSIQNDPLAKLYLTRARDLGFQLDSELEKFVNTP
jgi:tetratricopeptide (TPR) repeat protein